MNKMHLPPPFEPNTIPGAFFTSNKRKRSPNPSAPPVTYEEEEEEEDDEDDDDKEAEINTSAGTIDQKLCSNVSKPALKTVKKRKIRRCIPNVAPHSIFDDDIGMASSSLAPRPGVISDVELTRRRLPMKELLQDKAMTNYSRGEVSNALYVKNLSKQIEQNDLEFLFGSVVPPEIPLSCLQIQYFKQGKLKGQAFIEFPTIEMAIQAIDKLHGIKWYEDKPLIIVSLYYSYWYSTSNS
jgi:U11/U12 small nuclear ribonucleoprotein SNRNP65